MQSRRAILSSASLNQKSANLLSSPQNLTHSLSEFADDDLPSIGEVTCTSGTTESIRKSLGLDWSGDFDSLKQFVADSLKLKGVWSQPGGDKMFLPLRMSQLYGERIKIFCLSKEQKQIN